MFDQDIKISLKNYWRIFCVTVMLSLIMLTLAYYEINWAALILLFPVSFLFILMKICIITKDDADHAEEEQ